VVTGVGENEAEELRELTLLWPKAHRSSTRRAAADLMAYSSLDDVRAKRRRYLHWLYWVSVLARLLLPGGLQLKYLGHGY
jgi:hypothetical protein